MPDDREPDRTERTAATDAAPGEDGFRRPAPRRARTEEPAPGPSTGEAEERVDDVPGDAAADAAPADAAPTDAEPADRTVAEPGPSRTTSTGRSPAARAAQPDSAKARRRMIDSLLKPTKAQIAVAVVLCLVGLAVTTQIRAQRSEEGYSNARREDLVQLLDGINAETRRLEAESGELERSRSQLASGADAEQAAREEARRRQETLSVLAGTAPAAGPGIRLVITDPQGKITSGMLLDAVEEMRDAGAEVIEINDQVRVVGNSWFAEGPEGLVVDDQRVTSPITLEVIGDPRTLAEAARFRGGLISEITSPQVAATVELTEVSDLTVTSLHQPKANQYARPAPEPQR